MLHYKYSSFFLHTFSNLFFCGGEQVNSVICVWFYILRHTHSHTNCISLESELNNISPTEGRKVSEAGQVCLSSQQSWFAGRLLIWSGTSLWWLVGDSTRKCKSLSWRATFLSGHLGSLLLPSAASVSLHILARIPNTLHSSILSKSYFKQQIPGLGFHFSLLHSCLHRPYGLSPSPTNR